MKRFVIALLAILSSASITSGQTTPKLPNTLISGTILQSNTNFAPDYCSVNPGPSEFKRIGTGNALMEIPVLSAESDIPPSPYPSQKWQGLARLIFSTPSTGTIKFDSTSIENGGITSKILFSQYTQTFDTTQTLNVSFIIIFPNCSLQVSAIYRNKD